ncbi:MAG: 30S ribosomal protein S17 [Rhodobacteraceae bacterium]|nr:30S ribosomal protein S17 [Paracoccaceae bacterium]MCY4138080.1 30S ribosomal protein S17 [Paracoccaceae bacterium]
MPRRVLQGRVVSDRSRLTVTVSVERRFTHPVLKKTVRKTKKYHAHDAGGQCRVGDVVRIRECAPISKTKCWEVVADPA